MNPVTINPAALIMGLLALSLAMAKMGLEFILLVRKQFSKNGGITTGVYCNYPTSGACVWGVPDSARVRTYDITGHVADVLKPELEQQTELLREIRNEMRERR